MRALLHGNFPRRRVRWPVVIALCLFSLVAAAQGGHGGGHGGGGHGGGHFGGYHRGGHVFFGLGYWPWYYPPYYPSYYGYPPYYYPPTVVAPSSPPVYVERDDEQAVPQSAYWYHCANPQGYYPYVTQCSGGWQPVKPVPPPS